MHNHSYENEFNLHVNEISFSYERWTPRLALRKRLNVIRKWPIELMFCIKINMIKVVFLISMVSDSYKPCLY